MWWFRMKRSLFFVHCHGSSRVLWKCLFSVCHINYMSACMSSITCSMKFINKTILFNTYWARDLRKNRKCVVSQHYRSIITSECKNSIRKLLLHENSCLINQHHIDAKMNILCRFLRSYAEIQLSKLWWIDHLIYFRPQFRAAIYRLPLFIP